MGKYIVKYSSDAGEDLQKIYKSGVKATIKKVERLFEELAEHPYTGTGHPEPLRYRNNLWSRRIDKKNRLIYSVEEAVVTVYVVSALGHYDDK